MEKFTSHEQSKKYLIKRLKRRAEMRRKFTIKELNILLHIQDGIESCKYGDIDQAKHNFWEIANHLGIKDDDVFTKEVNRLPLEKII